MLSVVLIIIQNCTDNFDYDGKYILILIYTLIISFMLSKALSLLRMIKGNEITVILIVISMILFSYLTLYCFLYIFIKLSLIYFLISIRFSIIWHKDYLV